MAKKTTTTAKKKPGAIDRFLALSDVDKEAVYQSLDREIPFSETRSLTPAERKS